MKGQKKPCSTEFLRVQWRKITPNVTVYEAMRHSFCTQILDGGAELSQAQILLKKTVNRHAKLTQDQRPILTHPGN